MFNEGKAVLGWLACGGLVQPHPREVLGSMPFTLEQIRTHQVAFIRSSLTSEQAKAAWRTCLETGLGIVLREPMQTLISPEVVNRAVDLVWTGDTLRCGADAYSRALVPLFLEEARRNEDKLSSVVPQHARDKLDKVLEDPPRLNSAVIRNIMEHEALEEVMRDVLVRALREFSEKANPFFAEWGLPRLLRKVMPIGAGALLKSLGAIEEELHRHLEPEIRKFVDAFSGKALRSMADFAITHRDEPKFAAFRKAIASSILDEPVAQWVQEIKDSDVDRIREITIDIIEYAGRVAQAKEQRVRMVEAFFKANGSSSIGSFLGLSSSPPEWIDAFMEQTWPLVSQLLQSQAISDAIEKLIDESLAGLLDTSE